MVVGVFLGAVGCLTAGQRVQFHSYSLHEALVYTFTIDVGEADAWDSSSAESPPLSPRRAKNLATAFIKTIPLDPQMQSWRLRTIALECISEEPERWVYLVTFEGAPGTVTWYGQLPSFKVVVRMDGTIPKPTNRKWDWAAGTKQ